MPLLVLLVMLLAMLMVVLLAVLPVVLPVVCRCPPPTWRPAAPAQAWARARLARAPAPISGGGAPLAKPPRAQKPPKKLLTPLWSRFLS